MNDSADAGRLLAVATAMMRELRPADARVPRLDDDIARDLGLDSLARVELVARTDRAFGVRLPDRLAGEARTLGDLLRAIAGARSVDARQAGRERPRATPLPLVEGVPAAARTLVETYRWHLDRHPEREHVTVLDGDVAVERFSYAGLWAQAHEVAGGLAALGVGRGDAVALMLPTEGDFFRACLGVLLLGAIPVPLYPPMRWSQIAEHVRGRAAILANCEARVLVTVQEAMAIGRLVRAEVRALRSVTTVPALREASRGSGSALIADGSEGDTALLQYTSGSTGDPKGVILSHANLLANIRAMGKAARVRSEDRFVSWLPLYHDMGLIGAWFATLYHAVPLVVMPPTAFLGRPSRWPWAIDRYRATISAGPNFAYEIAATKIPDDDLDGLDVGSWRLAFNGAEPVRAETLERFARRFAPHGFDARAMTPVYGLAEAAVGLAFSPLERGPRVERVDARVLEAQGKAIRARDQTGGVPFVSSGVPLPLHEIRVVDARDRELPERSEGNVQFKGPSATRGYHRNADATTRLRHGDWLETGDVGFIAGGELFITSRAKDMIKRGGHNLHPYDLEAAVGEIPGIRKGCVAVFGTVAPGALSERIVVVAETRETDPLRREALRRRIQELANLKFQGPADDVVLAPPHAVLKTSSGKIRRSACRERYEAGTLGAKPRSASIQLAGLALRARLAALRRLARDTLRIGWGLRLWLTAAVVAAVVLVPLIAIPGEPRRLRLAHGAARAIVRLSGLTVEVDGRALVATTEPIIVVVNHASYVDAPILFAAIPHDLHFAAKREFATMPVLGFVLRRLGVHFVDRVDPVQGIEDTRVLERALSEGESIAIFAEGGFSRAPGLAPFRLGAFALGAQTGIAVVPVVLRGTRSVLRERRWMPVRASVSVVVLPPIKAEGNDWSAALRLRGRVRAAMLAVCGEPDLAGTEQA